MGDVLGSRGVTTKSLSGHNNLDIDYRSGFVESNPDLSNQIRIFGESCVGRVFQNPDSDSNSDSDSRIKSGFVRESCFGRVF